MNTHQGVTVAVIGLAIMMLCVLFGFAMPEPGTTFFIGDVGISVMNVVILFGLFGLMMTVAGVLVAAVNAFREQPMHGPRR
jgi:hypothetical protein